MKEIWWSNSHERRLFVWKLKKKCFRLCKVNRILKARLKKLNRYITKQLVSTQGAILTLPLTTLINRLYHPLLLAQPFSFFYAPGFMGRTAANESCYIVRNMCSVHKGRTKRFMWLRSSFLSRRCAHFSLSWRHCPRRGWRWLYRINQITTSFEMLIYWRRRSSAFESGPSFHSLAAFWNLGIKATTNINWITHKWQISCSPQHTHTQF